MAHLDAEPHTTIPDNTNIQTHTNTSLRIATNDRSMEIQEIKRKPNTDKKSGIDGDSSGGAAGEVSRSTRNVSKVSNEKPSFSTEGTAGEKTSNKGESMKAVPAKNEVRRESEATIEES